MNELRCVRCGDPIRPKRAWRKVSGWEKGRKSGGTNALALREPEDKFMCEPCMTLARMKVPPQEGLW